MDNYERIYYCFCGDNCKFETMTKEQIIAAIAEATGNTPTNIDGAFITKVKERNKGNALAFWIGTTAEYNALETKDELCYYIKTDDTTLDEINKAINQINKNFEALKAETPNFKRLLTSADDMNDVKEGGVYYCSTASLPANYPYENAGVIEVTPTGSKTSRIIQRVTRYGVAGATTFRTLYEGVWNNWTEIALKHDAFYTVGDVFAEAELETLAGYLTSGSKVIYLFLPLSKAVDMSKVTGVTLNALNATVRGVNGYVGTEKTNFADGTFDIWCKPFENGVSIKITNSAAFANATNNTPVAAQINSLSITFT